MQFLGSDGKNMDLSHSPHLDVHVNCLPSGSGYSGYVTFWYTAP